MKLMTKNGLSWILPFALFAASCGESTVGDEQVDPKDECVFCGDAKADAFGIERESYLAYGIVELANTASFVVLDDDVPLDKRAATGIVAQRPFEYIEQIDTVSYVGKTAFTNLARYANENGFVPFCGDGGLQNLLEACDDGNLTDGDGCSATCEIEAGGTPTFFAEQADLIKGSDIGVSLVNANGYYLRERPYSSLDISDEVMAILDRADGIIANSDANDRVSYDELALLSKEPFYSSLFQDEKDALADAWEIFEINTAEPAIIEWTHGRLSAEVPFESEIVRPGPLEVDPVRRIADLQDEDERDVARRLQQMSGLNADGNANTVEMADIEKGLGDLQPVFTSSEIYALQDIYERFFLEAEPGTGGDFVVKYATMPNQGPQVYTIAEFDGWKFNAQTTLEIQYDAYDYYSSYYYPGHIFDANLRSEFSFRTSLLFNNTPQWSCSGWSSSCDNPFRFTGVRWMHLDGTTAKAGRERAHMLMEHWKNGERVYNRVVEFKNTYSHTSNRRTYQNAYAGARPALADGTPLSLRKHKMVSYGSKDYQRFKLAEVRTVFNKNVAKFFPESADVLESLLKMGRYEEVNGVVIDVHESRAVIAYFDGCEMPLSFADGYLKSEVCVGSGRKVTISFDQTRSYLKVYSGSTMTDEVQLVNWLNPHYAIDLDRSYYVIK